MGRAAWFFKKRIVVRDLSNDEHRVLSAAEVEQLPHAARFLLDVHAFLPKGARRVVVFSSLPIESKLEPRCW